MEFTSQVQPWALGDDTGSAEIYDQNSYVFKVNGSPDWSGIMFSNTTESQTKGLTVMSYTAQKDDDSQKEAVPFDAAYSLDGGETWSSFDASSTGSAINGLYGIAGTGNAGSIDGLEYGLTAQSRTPSQPGSHEYWTGGHGDWSPSDWSSKDVMYLNRYNFRSDGHEFSQNTANCYIIRHAGKYCIPMVYGNGQLNGSNNKKAFWFGSQDTGALPTCLNYIGQPITSPIIAEDLGIVDPENSHSQVDATLGRFSAAVLWSDVSGVITDVRVAADSDFAWNGYYHKIHGIFFTVDPEKVCQCNAVIAVKDASGQVVWSWHIWITNDPGIGNPTYETVKENGRVFDYFPIPALGFRNGAVYFGRPSMLLKLRQQRSGREIVYLVSQKDVEASASVLYYQHGRKDPFRASAAFVSMPGSGNDVVNATKEPARLYSGWTDGGYSNLWSGAYSTPGSYVECQEEMRKTIYDPSPKGFRVPVQPAYSPFMIDKVLGNFMKGYYFKLSADDKEGIFFGAYGYKGSGSSVTDNEAAGHYWTAIPETSFYGGTFEFNSEAASLPVNIPLSAACPVRPVTDPDYKQ